MKKILTIVFLFSLFSVFAGAYPGVIKPVNDYAGILSPWYESQITRKIIEHKKKTGVQIAVVTVHTTGKESLEDYSLKTAQQWQGGSSERNDGLLYLVALDDRKMRIEVGDGLTGYVDDMRAVSILKNIRKEYRAHRYGPGTLRVIDELCAITSDLEEGQEIPLARKIRGIAFSIMKYYTFFFIISAFITAGFLICRKALKLKFPVLVLGGMVIWAGVPLLIFFFYPGVWNWNLYLYLSGIPVGGSLYGVYLMKGKKMKALSLIFSLAPAVWLGWASVAKLDILRPNPYGTSQNETVMLIVLIMALFFQLLVWLMVYMTAIDGFTSGGGGEYYNTNNSGYTGGSGSSSSSSSSGSSWGGSGGSFSGGGGSGSW